MNPINQWAAALDSLKDLPHSPAIIVLPAVLSHDVLTLAAEGLSHELAKIGNVSGWILETGAVRELRDTRAELEGLPLDGEWQRGDEHWQLEFVHDNEWRLHRYRLQTDDVADPTHLAEKRYQHHTERKGRIAYWCLWRPDDEDDYRPPIQDVALFAGFED